MATIKIKNPDYVEGSGVNKWISVSTLNVSEADKIITTEGDGTKYLSDDGTYKEVVTDLPDVYTKEEVDSMLPTKVSLLENDVPYALQADVEVEVETEIKNGVYAVTADGELISYKDADESCIAVALITNNQKIMIEKYGAAEQNIEILKTAYEADGIDFPENENDYDEWDLFCWGCDGIDIPNINNFNITDDPTLDFNGKSNTDTILATLDTNDYIRVKMSTYCRCFNTSLSTYKEWYIPAASQFYEMYLNISEIENMLIKIGGTNLDGGSYYWCSSECNYDYGIVHNPYGKWADTRPKQDYHRIRFVHDIFPTITKKILIKEKIVELASKTELPTRLSQLENDANYILEDVVKHGVYIVDLEGKLYTTENWTGGSNATGVALINDNVSIIIAPKNWYTSDGLSYDGAWNGNKRSAWGGYDKTVTGIKTTESKSDAITDFAGSANTDAIISQLKGTTDNYSQYYTGAPAAEYCRAYSNGCKGAGQWYLPAAGEYNQIVSNKAVIEEALTAISGELFSSPGCEWTSTQYRSDSAWLYNWEYGFLGSNSKNIYYGIRPVCAFEVKTLKERVSDLETLKQDRNLYFNNVTSSNWVDSTEYPEYPYQCDITCEGVDDTMYAEVIFDVVEATGDNYAPVCDTMTNVVRIYSKVNTSITIPTIIISQ